MNLYYFDKSTNFGDQLNAWLWPRLLPGRWDPVDGVRFSGIGTIINADMPNAPRWIVFSSGAGYGPPPSGFGDARWKVVAVRGPLSASVLGLPKHAAVTDGALLLASLPEYAPTSERASRTVFVPHFEAEARDAWPEACQRAGIEYVSPLEDCRTVIERIRGARLVLAEAMHAAIVADSLRVPWVAVSSSPKVSSFKWLDWTQSMELPYLPLQLPASTTDAAWRNLMLWSYDAVHRFPPSADPLVLYSSRYRQERGAWHRALSRSGRRLHRRGDRIIRGSGLSRLRKSADERRIDRAATALLAACRSAGMMSSEKIFDQRLDTLVERLQALD